MNTYHLLIILVPLLGIFVTLIFVIIKLGRNTVTKGDLNNSNNSIESPRSELNKRFEEVNRRLDEAADDRKRIEAEAAAERKEINAEIVRHNQNYIEHLAHHNTPKSNPVSEEDDST